MREHLIFVGAKHSGEEYFGLAPVIDRPNALPLLPGKLQKRYAPTNATRRARSKVHICRHSPHKFFELPPQGF